MFDPEYLSTADELCAVVREFGTRQWCLGTGGNFSVRLDAQTCLISQSGREKSSLVPDDLMVCDMDGNAGDSRAKPSAEMPLHLALYRRDASIGAVFHTHSVEATVLSRRAGRVWILSGFEMQKTLAGQHTHRDSVTLPVFANDQDMDALAAEVLNTLPEVDNPAPGFLVRGHGLYAWGRSIAEAKRHVEGLEFLVSCSWQEQLARVAP